ncbi:MAG: cytidylate kinase, partial [Pelagibacteraceae bacterium]|nr:cytidylate kinase [Pelagibacteraceae bacterium]MBT6448218.1 cytidylate kinase [Flavobacteriaceae bacterium]
QLIDNGEKSIYLKILEDIKLRDKKDKTRKNSPLVVPKGAKIIDNSLSFKNTIAQITEIIEGIN